MRMTALVLTLVLTFGIGLVAADKKMAKSSNDPEALIRSIWESFKNKDAKSFESMITSDASMADMRGLEDKAAIMKDLQGCDIKSYSLSDFKQTQIDKDASVVTYHVMLDGNCEGQKMPDHVIASDVVAKRGGKWVSVFHQETGLAAAAPKM
jgi:hypothetical protein